ncbi:hypothetical protein ACWGNU_21290 [Paenibacillus lautus]
MTGPWPIRYNNPRKKFLPGDLLIADAVRGRLHRVPVQNAESLSVSFQDPPLGEGMHYPIQVSVRGAKQGGGKAGVRHFMLPNIIKRQPDEQAFDKGFNLGLDRNVWNNAAS